MMQSVSTTNLLEVAHLLDRYHRITRVEVKPGRYGVNELEVTLEGDGIQLDRGTFLTCKTGSLQGLPKVLETLSFAVQETEQSTEERRLV